MKKLLAVAAAVVAGALAGCGSDSGACAAVPAVVQQPTVGSCGALQADSVVQVSVRAVNTPGQCQTCAETSPSCDVDPVGSADFHLDTQYQQCENDRGCGTGCAFQPTFTCSFRTPAVSNGQILLRPNVSPNGPTGQPVPVTLVAQGATTCTL